jgi:hypothetical protein
MIFIVHQANKNQYLVFGNNYICPFLKKIDIE